MKDAQENSFQSQQEYFTEYIQRHPGWVFAGMYSDDGISGLSIRKRDGFNSMVTDALDGKIDLILTKSLSRFARNTVDALTMRIPVKRRARSGGTVRPFQRKRRSRSILNGVKRRPSVLSDQRSQFLTELRPLVS